MPQMHCKSCNKKALPGALTPARAVWYRWEFSSNGSLSGRVYGKKGFREGENMTTSLVPMDQRFGHYVRTASGSIYRLGEPRVHEFELKKSRRLMRDRTAGARPRP